MDGRINVAVAAIVTVDVVVIAVDAAAVGATGSKLVGVHGGLWNQWLEQAKKMQD